MGQQQQCIQCIRTLESLLWTWVVLGTNQQRVLGEVNNTSLNAMNFLHVERAQ